jgi:hypothetical protein
MEQNGSVPLRSKQPKQRARQRVRKTFVTVAMAKRYDEAFLRHTAKLRVITANYSPLAARWLRKKAVAAAEARANSVVYGAKCPPGIVTNCFGSSARL